MKDPKINSAFFVESVLSYAWNILKKNLLAFLLITLPYTTVLILGQMAVNNYLSNLHKWGIFIVNFFTPILIHAIFQSAMNYAVFMLLIKDQILVLESFKRSASRTPSVFIGLVIQRLVALLTQVVVPFLIIGLSMFFGGILYILVMLVVTGYTFLFLIYCFLFDSVCVIEQIGIIESFKRSFELTREYRLRITIFTVIMAVVLISSWYITRIFAFGGLISAVLSILIILIPLTYFSILSVVIYYSIRVEKEGFTPVGDGTNTERSTPVQIDIDYN